MVLCCHERLKMFVRASMPLCPRCLRWMLEMLSGPAAPDFLSAEMTLAVSLEVNGAGAE